MSNPHNGQDDTANKQIAKSRSLLYKSVPAEKIDSSSDEDSNDSSLVTGPETPTPANQTKPIVLSPKRKASLSSSPHDEMRRAKKRQRSLQQVEQDITRRLLAILELLIERIKAPEPPRREVGAVDYEKAVRNFRDEFGGQEPTSSPFKEQLQVD